MTISAPGLYSLPGWEATDDGAELPAQVICPEGDYWPLPWYLRQLHRVGWYSEVPAGPFAPAIIMDPSPETRLAEELAEPKPYRKTILLRADRSVRPCSAKRGNV